MEELVPLAKAASLKKGKKSKKKNPKTATATAAGV
jgi:hypothetical protein